MPLRGVDQGQCHLGPVSLWSRRLKGVTCVSGHTSVLLLCLADAFLLMCVWGEGGGQNTQEVREERLIYDGTRRSVQVFGKNAFFEQLMITL